MQPQPRVTLSAFILVIATTSASAIRSTDYREVGVIVTLAAEPKTDTAILLNLTIKQTRLVQQFSFNKSNKKVWLPVFAERSMEGQRILEPGETHLFALKLDDKVGGDKAGCLVALQITPTTYK